MRLISVPKIALLLLYFSIVLMMTGQNLNLKVIEANNGMPVLIEATYSIRHFAIQNVSEIEYLYLADIYPILGWMLSLGDLFLFAGFFLFVISSILICYKPLLGWFGLGTRTTAPKLKNWKILR